MSLGHGDIWWADVPGDKIRPVVILTRSRVAKSRGRAATDRHPNCRNEGHAERRGEGLAVFDAAEQVVCGHLRAVSQVAYRASNCIGCQRAKVVLSRWRALPGN